MPTRSYEKGGGGRGARLELEILLGAGHVLVVERYSLIANLHLLAVRQKWRWLKNKNPRHQRRTPKAMHAVSRRKKSSWRLGSSSNNNMRMYVTMPASHARAAPNVQAHLARSLAQSKSFPNGATVSVRDGGVK